MDALLWLCRKAFRASLSLAYAFTPPAGDEATREMVVIIMKALDNYAIEPKERPRPPGHKTW